jgi:hypothetical protein
MIHVEVKVAAYVAYHVRRALLKVGAVVIHDRKINFQRQNFRHNPEKQSDFFI